MKTVKFHLQTFLTLVVLLINQSGLLAQTPFTPQDAVSYLSYATTNNGPTGLYAVNVATNTRTAIITPAAGGIRFNAIGYNVQDNFIYGALMGGTTGTPTGTSQIVRIGADGAYNIITVGGLTADTYEAGDIDNAGNLYLYSSSTSSIRKINLGTLAISNISVTSYNLPDISVNADGSVIWGISAGNGNLGIYSVTGTTSTAAARDIGSAAFNSLTLYDSRGNLFAISEGTSDVYLLNPAGGPQAQVLNNTNVELFQADGAQPKNRSVYTNTQPAFGCEAGIGYAITQTGGNLYRINAQSSEYALAYSGIGGNLSLEVNNMGLNPKDGYLYAYRFSTNQLVRIGSDGSAQYVPIANLPSNVDFSSGEFDKDGVFYLMNGQSSSLIRRVVLDPASPNFGNLLGDLTVSPPVSALTDMTVNPIDDNLYGVSASGNLIRINRLTGALTNLGTVTGDGADGNVVIAFSDATGALYYQRTGQTTMYKLDAVHTGADLAAEVFYVSNQNFSVGGDGARCLTAGFSLPVNFGPVAATYSQNSLTVKWQTISETNNSYFEVEASADGTNFTKIGEVKTRAVNGDSDIALNYEFTKSISGISLGLGLGLLALGAIGFGKRKSVLGTMAIVAGMAFSIIGCQKSGSSDLEQKKVFVRIAQVDTDGTKKYSSIVKAVSQ